MLWKVKLFLFLSVAGQNLSNSNFTYDEYPTVISNVQRVCKASSLFIFHLPEDVFEQAQMLWSLSLSQSNVAVTDIEKISDVLQKYVDKIDKPLFVVFLTSKKSVAQLNNALNASRISFPKWLLLADVIVNGQAKKFCSEAKENFMNLAHTPQFFAICDDDEIKGWREWLDQAERYRILELDEKTGLIHLEVTDYRNKLRGKKLNVVNVERIFSNVFEGDIFFTQLRNMMMESMNISVDHFIVEKNSGHFRNGTWTGVLGKIAKGHFDIALEAYVVTPLRMSDFDFPNIGYSEDMYLYVRKPNRFQVSWFIYFQNFHYTLWMTIIATIGLHIVAHALTMENAENRVQRFLESYFKILGVFYRQGISEKPKNESAKMVLFIAFFTSFMVCVTYEAFLIGHLVAKQPSLPFHNWKTFLADKSYKLAVVKDSYIENEFLNERSEDFRNLLINNLPDNSSEALSKICDDKIAFLQYQLYFEEFPCDLILVHTGISSHSSFVLQNDSPYKEIFSYSSLRLLETGNLRHAIKRVEISERNSSTVASNKRIPQIRIEAVTPLLLLLVCGCALSLVMLFGEIMFARHCTQFTKQCRPLRDIPMASPLRLINVPESSQRRNISQVWDLPGPSNVHTGDISILCRRRKSHASGSGARRGLAREFIDNFSTTRKPFVRGKNAMIKFDEIPSNNYCQKSVRPRDQHELTVDIQETTN